MKKTALKRGLAVLLTALLCLSLFPAAMAAGEPALVVSTAEAKAGETVEVTVSLQNNPGLTSIPMTVVYDESVLSLESAAFDDAKWDAFTADYNAANGTSFTADQLVMRSVEFLPKINFALGDSYYAEDGVLVTLTFKVKEGAEAGKVAAVSVTTEKIITDTSDPAYESNNPPLDKDLNEIELVNTAGSVTVKSEAAGLLGDVNGDGNVNTADAMLIARSVLSPTHARYKALTPEQIAVADINGDGNVNTADAMLIARSVLSPTHPRYKPL